MLPGAGHGYSRLFVVRSTFALSLHGGRVRGSQLNSSLSTMQTNESSGNVDPNGATTATTATPVAVAVAASVPRRPKPGILRLDINKPRRSSGGSVDFRFVSGAGVVVAPAASGAAGAGGVGGGASSPATVANSEVSEHDLVDTRECLRFAQHTCNKRTEQTQLPQKPMAIINLIPTTGQKMQ